jgi:predicted O-methyltransferase YrrM
VPAGSRRPPLLNDSLERIFRAHYAGRDTESAQGLAPSSIAFESGVLLYHFVRRERPLRTLETGMAYGMSTLFICQALRDNGAGVHTAIDPSQERYGSGGLRNVERAGLADLLRFHPERSDEALPRLRAAGETFDFAFVDGNHRFDFTLVDFFYVDRMLPVGGHVAFDDLWLPAVRKVISYALRNRPYRRVPGLSTRPRPWNRLLATGRRIAQNPLDRDWALKLAPGNVAFLRKAGDEVRDWRSHRAF